MPVTHKDFGVDTAFPPPPPYPPNWPTNPPPPGPPPPRPSSQKRHWPRIAAAACAGAVLAGVAAVGITLQIRGSGDETLAAEPTTVTVAAPTPRSPSPLPPARADRLTCDSRSEASRLISEASTAQGVIPEGMDILDPAVQANPALKAGVQEAGRLYGEASAVLKVAPGTTPLLANAVTTASKALRALSTAYVTFNPVNGNTYQMASEASTTMDVLCERL